MAPRATRSRVGLSQLRPPACFSLPVRGGWLLAERGAGGVLSASPTRVLFPPRQGRVAPRGARSGWGCLSFAPPGSRLTDARRPPLRGGKARQLPVWAIGNSPSSRKPRSGYPGPMATKLANFAQSVVMGPRFRGDDELEKARQLPACFLASAVISAGSNLLMSSISSLVMMSRASTFCLSTPHFSRKSI